MIGVNETVEQVFQNKLATALEILTEERQRVTTREVMRGPHRDKDQRERLREITTLQIALTVLTRPKGECDKGPEEQPRTRDRSRRKTQSWAVMRSLDMIAPEVTNPTVLHMLPSSNLDLLTQLVQKWKDWKMSEVDDIVQTQAKTNHAQEWAKQRRIFLEKKHGLSLLTGSQAVGNEGSRYSETRGSDRLPSGNASAGYHLNNMGRSPYVATYCVKG